VGSQFAVRTPPIQTFRIFVVPQTVYSYTITGPKPYPFGPFLCSSFLYRAWEKIREIAHQRWEIPMDTEMGRDGEMKWSVPSVD
jgi:hypothetical protein